MELEAPAKLELEVPAELEPEVPGRGLTKFEKHCSRRDRVTGYGQESGVRYHTSAAKFCEISGSNSDDGDTASLRWSLKTFRERIMTPSSGRKLSKNEWRKITSPSRVHIAYVAHNKREN